MSIKLTLSLCKIFVCANARSCISTKKISSGKSFVKGVNINTSFISSSKRYYHKPRAQLITMKLDTPEFHALFTPELKRLVDIFDKYKYELRISGGAVRDLLSGQIPHDIDLATTATPDEMKGMFQKEEIRMLNMKGEKHGTITCRINDKENYEVTTLRIDVVTDGRHAEVEFTRDWELDALRRDLTVNAMFLGLDGTVYDYFQGKEDLKAKKVCFVGEAAARMQEDFLRILRYFRFYGRISVNENAHEAETLQAIKENMHGLGGISGERIWMELKKIATGNHAHSLVKIMMDLGMTKYIGLPENPNTEEFSKIWKQCHMLEPSPTTLFAALIDTEEQVYAFHERVKMSREELRNSVFLVNHRYSDMGDDPFTYCKNLQCDSAGKEPKVRDRILELLKYRGDKETLEKYSAWTMPRFPVNGHRLLEMGVPKGPPLAKMLNALRQKWKESAFEYTEDNLMEFVEELKTTIK